MVSTFLDYRTLTTNFRASLDRVASSKDVARETDYYNAKIGKVANVEEFLDDYRLYSFAMKAHGLEDMIYAKAFMRKVLESDLTDSDSYANRLSDNRYREFAAAFQFNTGATAAQTAGQIENVVAEYKTAQGEKNDAIKSENTFFKSAIASVTSVDQLLSSERLRTYVLKAFDIDGTYWNRDFLKKVMTSDVNDTQSFVNTLTGPTAADYKALAAAFNFNATGTLDAGKTAQTASQSAATVEAYTFSAADGRALPVVGEADTAYMKSKLATVTNVDDLVNDSRLFAYVTTSFGLPSDMLKSTLKNILTSDVTQANNYATTFGGKTYEAVAKAFNFATDGTIKSGLPVQAAAQTDQMAARYMTRFDDAQEETDEGTYDFYTSYMASVKSVEDLIGTTRAYNFVLSAFGFDPATEDEDTIVKALTSDLNDPKSFANQQTDPRYREMARMFNFGTDGEASAPALALATADIVDISKDYVIIKTRYGNSDKREDADAAAKSFNEKMQKIDNLKEFLADRSLIDFVLEAKGVDPKTVSDDTVKRLFASDLTNENSFANTQADTRLRDIVATFNFDAEGNIRRGIGDTIQSRAGQLRTTGLYIEQTLEQQTGETNNGVRLALYFKRMAPAINSAYDILGDTALLEVFRTAFELPKEISSMDIEKQAALVERNLTLSDLQDPEKLEKFINRFAAMYDLANDTSAATAASLFSSKGSISADTLYSLAQLKIG